MQHVWESMTRSSFKFGSLLMIASLTGFHGSTLTAQSKITNQVIFSELGPQIVLNIEACFFPFGGVWNRFYGLAHFQWLDLGKERTD